MNRKQTLTTVFWSLGIIGAGLCAALVLLWTAPETRPEEQVQPVRLVQTLSLSPRTVSVSVSAEGPVIPAREVVMKPEVRGRVIEHHESLVPGGYIEAGEQLIQIDPADYELALEEQETALEEAMFEFAVERGRQVVASREWLLLENALTNSEVNRALVLREPHLRRIEAMLRQATNEINRAQLALSRTSVKAPFNAMVLQEAVEIGQLLETGSEICTLVGTDEFWVQATLNVDDLRWIRLPNPGRPGPAARVTYDVGDGRTVQWDGQVARLLSNLEPNARMARLLIRVPDPLGLDENQGRMPLLLDSYVSVEIDAGEMEDVLAVPLASVREGDRVFLVNQDNEVVIRDAEVRWTQGDTALIANVAEPGEQLIVGGLRTALPGMKVSPQPLATDNTPDPDTPPRQPES
ncbi:MAG TPA: efflux RND transporter periplasmic adaptor subunit [Methylomirabilota bacterium]|nr:efflux RND transporter periplasmic adaptor subunit [Methylomirabilota bacterium]